MGTSIYLIAALGFMQGGWSFWDGLWWPYYLAKHIAQQAKEEPK